MNDDLDPERYQRVIPAEAIAYLAEKVSIPTEGWRDTQDAEHDAAFVVAGAKGAILSDIRQAVEQGIQQGLGIRDFMAEFDRISQRWAHRGDKDWRARVIWDTNVAQAYAAGRYSHQLDPGVLAVFPYLEYVHSDSLKPRPHHLALDGKIFRADQMPFYPPNGFNCRCRTVSVGDEDLQGRQVSEIRRGDLVPYTDERGNPGQARVEPDQGFDYIPGRSTPQDRAAMLERMAAKMPPQIGRFVTQETREILRDMGVDVEGLPVQAVPDGTLGMVVENPGLIEITNWEGRGGHALRMLEERQITREQVIKTIENPVIVLKQDKGFLYVGRDLAVAVGENGKLRTAYNRVRKVSDLDVKDGFDPDLLEVLESYGAKP